MPRSLATRSAAALLGLSFAAALTLTGCSSDSDKGSNSKLTVLASTNVWGAVAEAIVGDKANVESVIKDPSADPHSYESSPRDAAEITDADLVVYNGGGYDPYIDKVLPNSKNKDLAINAFNLRVDQSDQNEHIFYDIPTVERVAKVISDAIGTVDGRNTEYYAKRFQEFDAKLKGISAISAKIAADHPKAPVVQTEPIAHYLLRAAGADDRTPPEFEHAIEEGNDPPPAAVAATRDLLTGKHAKALVYNTQTEDKVTQDIQSTATKAGVKVVDVTETLPDGLDYIQWQTKNAQSLESALS